MTEGVVQGGWEFVIAAYTISALGFGGYAAWLIVRLKESKRHD